jgi:hypothetical protein
MGLAVLANKMPPIGLNPADFGNERERKLLALSGPKQGSLDFYRSY